MSTEQRLREAVGHQQAGRANDALEICEIILADQPEHIVALNLAGIAHAQMGNGWRAIELLQRAVNAQPGNPDTQRNLTTHDHVTYRTAIVI